MKKLILTLVALFLSSGIIAQDTVPESLKSATWKTHLEKDLIPFWITPEALGNPVGNYPTVRDMIGRTTNQTLRRPRMMGRQIFTYCIYYMVTGKTELLDYAEAGVRWLIDHAWDKTYGGWYTQLKEDGSALANQDKTAQDTAYAAMGLAAYYYVTRDKEAEEYLLKTEALMFDPKTYWDEAGQRVRDAMNADLTQEKDVEAGGWELVALLDQLNAYMIIVQPILTKAEDRERWASHMILLGDTIQKTFWQAPIFWGQKDKVGRGGNHVDFGHHFKTLWMLALVDQNTGGNRYTDFVRTTAREQLPKAIDPKTGLWGSSSRTFLRVNYGSSWWIYAECDQITAYLNLLDQRFTSQLAVTGEGWLKYFVDKKNGEVYSDIRADGSHNNYSDEDTSKVWDWKNGFHAAEHALIMYMHGATLEKTPLPLYFAFPKGSKNLLTPAYILPLKETQRVSEGLFKHRGQDFEKIRVSYLAP